MQTARDVVLDIERRVSDGLLVPGDRLPPVRTHAANVGLAPNTVAAAYRTLSSRGIVVGRGRAGTFVSARPPLAAHGVPKVPSGVVDLATGNPDLAFLPNASDASVADGGPVLYGAPATNPALAAAAIEWLRRDGVTVQQVTPVSGALDGMERVLGANLRAGDRVAVEDPAYASVLDLVGAVGLLPVPVPVDDRGVLAEPLERVLAAGVEAIIITPRAQNPFGAALDAERVGELRTVLSAAPDVLIVEDDHAGRVGGAPLRSVIDPGRARWAHVRSVAKELGPDLRLAVVVCDETTRHRLVGRQRVGPGWVSHHLQRAAAGLLTDPGVDRLLSRAAGAYRERRTRLTGALAEAGLAAHGASGLNVWVPVADEGAAVAAMLERGFAVRAGSSFRMRSPAGVRITVAGQDVDVLDDVAAALIDVLAGSEPLRGG